MRIFKATLQVAENAAIGKKVFEPWDYPRLPCVTLAGSKHEHV